MEDEHVSDNSHKYLYDQLLFSDTSWSVAILYEIIKADLCAIDIR